MEERTEAVIKADFLGTKADPGPIMGVCLTPEDPPGCYLRGTLIRNGVRGAAH